jgi:hypothetical protein
MAIPLHLPPSTVSWIEAFVNDGRYQLRVSAPVPPLRHPARGGFRRRPRGLQARPFPRDWTPSRAALPPLVPLSWLSCAPEEASWIACARALPAALTVQGPRFSAGSWTLPVEEADALVRARALLDPRPSAWTGPHTGDERVLVGIRLRGEA